MADQPAKKKRQIKNPETFRERAAKAVEASGQPKRASQVKQASSHVTGPVRRITSRIFNSAPFRILIPKYFRESWQELKLVTWPNWSEGRRLTVAVLIFAIVFGAVIAGVDWVLDRIFQHLLLK